MFDVITFGSATKDIFLETGSGFLFEDKRFSTGKGVCFSLGSKVKAERMHLSSGGGGTNTAVTFARQGFSVAYCGKLGEDIAGRSILKELKMYGIDTRFVSFSEEKTTNHSVVLHIPKVDRTIFIYRGASDTYSEEDVFFKNLNSRWFYFAPFSFYAQNLFFRLVEHGIQKDIKMMANPSIEQLKDKKIKDSLKDVNVLLLNMEEAAVLTGVSYEKEGEILEKVSGLARDAVLLTRGVRGVVAYGNGVYYCGKPIFPKAVDRTGAGDSFGSGFLSEFMRSGSIKKGIQLGIANSTACLQKEGAKKGLLERGDSFKDIPIFSGPDIEAIKKEF